jgi:hypothetical protein
MFLKSSTIIETLSKLADIHLDNAIQGFKHLRDYRDENIAFSTVITHLETSHSYFYSQRLESWKNAYNLSLHLALSMGFNGYKYINNQYKEAYVACLLAATHCCLRNNKYLIENYIDYAVYAIHDRPLKKEDKIYFPDNSLANKTPLSLQIKHGVMLSLWEKSFYANPRNWDYADKDEAKKRDTLILDNIRKLGTNLLDIAS